MTEKKELKQEELEQVSGGGWFNPAAKVHLDNLLNEYNKKVDESEVGAYIGKTLLFVGSRQYAQYFFGYVWNWREVSAGCGTDYKGEVSVGDKNGYEDLVGKVEITFDDYSIYAN